MVPVPGALMLSLGVGELLATGIAACEVSTACKLLVVMLGCVWEAMTPDNEGIRLLSKASEDLVIVTKVVAEGLEMSGACEVFASRSDN